MIKLKQTLKYFEYQILKIRSLIISDSYFLSARLKRIYGYKPDIRNPVTLNEKICHRLIYNRDPLFTSLADKLAVRKHISLRTNKVELVPLIGVYNDIREIEPCALPNKFVMKCNHDSGSVIICHDKETFDFPMAMKKINHCLRKNMYYKTREWQYKNIKPVILCEKYIDIYTSQRREVTPEMLRVHCFHGTVGFIEADYSDAKGNEYINVFDSFWNLQPFNMEYPNTPYVVPKPRLLHQAVLASQELSEGIDYCRVDLIVLEQKIYFSEITLSPRRGMLIISPVQWDTTLGRMWTL
ncbi:glycosyl transferase [Klebsiella sp. CTHL.F3a]|uniref:ATP-grasp fold amidoligase family protein n=1 Tax=Klebsiella sp. CTHL.F3a TaxID=2873296 RepID=UPI001CA77AC5|nr:ATP-grasp fold amidoligase family protein [Klebsiella sp. CTHL.F3a]QZY78812.1 glycosyl transferase [Klebsiella sp. CTHL.F3a]